MVGLDFQYLTLIKKVNTDVLDVMLRSDIIPVLAPIATSDKGQTLNVNADTAAGALAAALKAERLLMLTDVQGVLDAKGKLVSRLTQRRAATLIRSGTAKGGMIPKIETALAAVKNGNRQNHANCVAYQTHLILLIYKQDNAADFHLQLLESSGLLTLLTFRSLQTLNRF